jgi:hypothetical protein
MRNPLIPQYSRSKDEGALDQMSNDQWWWARRARRLGALWTSHPQLVICHWDLAIPAIVRDRGRE